MRALDDVTVEIPDGHFACIVGASGCGKSTLLNIMAGLMPPDRRHDRGRRARRWRGRAPTAGWCSRATRSSRGCACGENIEFGPSLKGVTTDERRRIADALLEEMRLAEFARAYPSELSGGMKQRVAIARALANDPDVLLMDEPFGALDALTRAGAQRFLTQIWEQHRRTIVFVTHDIDEAIYLGDTVYVMSPRPGRVKEIVAVDIAAPALARRHRHPALRGAQAPDPLAHLRRRRLGGHDRALSAQAPAAAGLDFRRASARNDSISKIALAANSAVIWPGPS